MILYFISTSPALVFLHISPPFQPTSSGTRLSTSLFLLPGPVSCHCHHTPSLSPHSTPGRWRSRGGRPPGWRRSSLAPAPLRSLSLAAPLPHGSLPCNFGRVRGPLPPLQLRSAALMLRRILARGGRRRILACCLPADGRRRSPDGSRAALPPSWMRQWGPAARAASRRPGAPATHLALIFSLLRRTHLSSLPAPACDVCFPGRRLLCGGARTAHRRVPPPWPRPSTLPCSTSATGTAASGALVAA
jgi:hypothetical protein